MEKSFSCAIQKPLDTNLTNNKSLQRATESMERIIKSLNELTITLRRLDQTLLTFLDDQKISGLKSEESLSD